MSKKNTIFDKAMQKKEDEQRKEKIYDNLNIDREKNTIIIEKKNNFSKVTTFLSNTASLIVKIIFYIMIIILLTIGATVLLNNSLRSTIIDIFTSVL